MLETANCGIPIYLSRQRQIYAFNKHLNRSLIKFNVYYKCLILCKTAHNYDGRRGTRLARPSSLVSFLFISFRPVVNVDNDGEILKNQYIKFSERERDRQTDGIEETNEKRLKREEERLNFSGRGR